MKFSYTLQMLKCITTDSKANSFAIDPLPLYGWIVCVLCVGVAVLEFAQVCRWGRLLFVFATFFGACLGCGSALISHKINIAQC